MMNEYDPIEAAKAAFDDIVDDAPLAPSWESATSQYARLSKIEPKNRSRFTVLGVAAALIVVVGSVAVFAALSGTPSDDAGATIDYVQLRWSQEVVMVCEGMEISDYPGADEATIEIWGPNRDNLVRADVTTPDGSIDRVVFELGSTRFDDPTNLWSTTGRLFGQSDLFHSSSCDTAIVAGEQNAYSMADGPGSTVHYAPRYLGLPITDPDGVELDPEAELMNWLSARSDMWRGLPVTVYSNEFTDVRPEYGGTNTTEIEIWFDSATKRYEREVYRATDTVLGTVNTTLEVLDRGLVNPEDVSFSIDGLIPDPRNGVEPTPPDETVSTTTAPPPTTTTSTSPTTTTTSPLLESEAIETGPLAPRGGHSVVWTGSEVIVWGGERDESGGELFADGAAFDPETGTWRVLSESPIAGRRYHIATWTGTEMLIMGGFVRSDGAAYQPANDTWRVLGESPISLRTPSGAPDTGFIGTVWNGSELFVWNVGEDVLAAYDPATDQWRSLPPTDMGSDRGVLRSDGETVYAFGATVEDYPATNDLSAMRLVDDVWMNVPAVGFSTDDHTIGADPTLTAWAGDRFLAWSDSGLRGTTSTFDPATDTWSLAPDIPIPGCEGNGEPISTPATVFAFGWCSPDVAMFDGASGTWSEAAVGGYPTARYTVWTGNELINWGDTCCYGAGGTPFTVKAWRFQPGQ